jgi:sigma-E factor negative regulatory protein RseC
MQEIGIVKDTDGIFARVVIGRKNSCCESCEKETCDIPENGVETEAINTANAKIGQKVKVVMKTQTYIKGILILYALPILAFFTGAVLGEMYLPRIFGGTDSQLLAAFGGFFLFFASFGLIKTLSKRLEKKTENKSVIEAVIE